MITYDRSAYGWRLIFRVHGSAVYRSVLPALVSVGIFFIFSEVYSNNDTAIERELLHPYAVGVLVASTTFLIVFKLNQSYSRYWEAAGAVHQLMSKWMDATTHTAMYHMQCDHYKDIKPPSYFDYPQLNHLYMTRERERNVNYDDLPPYNGGPSGDPEGRIWSATAGLRKRNNGVGSSHRPGAVTESTAPQPPIPHEKTFGGNMRASSVSDSVDDNEDSRIFTGNNHHGSLASSRREQFSSERSHREIRSVVKSINYVENHTKREKAAKKIVTNGGRMPSFPCIDESGLDGEDEADSDDGEVSVAESLFFASHLNQSDDEIDFASTRSKKPTPLWGKPRLDGNWGEYYTKNPDHPLATFFDPAHPSRISPKGFRSIQGGRTTPLFLQELAHLSSLLVAVALSTLRNDIEGAESPLGCYEPGSPWPAVDPTKDEYVQMNLLNCFGSFSANLKTFLSIGKSAEERTRLNAARPLPVVGGVSDAEIRFLQMARGPYAKTQLCFNWLTEFIIREHLAGTLGEVGPPIISRIVQFLGDGMIFYNHARKIMFIPFPFVHAQLSVIYILTMVWVVPFLMDQYVNEPWIGALLTFFAVLCLSGINEVSRELENPFRNIPNELPLVTFAAHYNEALYTMYAGYHPDFFWDGDRVLRNASCATCKSKQVGVEAPRHSPEMRTCGHRDCEAGASANATAASSRISVSPTPPTTSTHTKQTEDTTETGDASSSNTAASAFAVKSTNGKEDTKDDDAAEEIAALKKQMEEQSKLIERLFAKVGNLDDKDLEKMTEDSGESRS